MSQHLSGALVIQISRFPKSITSSSRIRTSRLLARPSGDILPRGAKSSAGARKEPFLFFLFGIGIQLVFIKLRCPEKGCDEHNQEYSYDLLVATLIDRMGLVPRKAN